MTSSPRLTPEQVKHFREEGYLIFDQPVLSQDKFNSLIRLFEHLLDAHEKEGKRPEAMDKPHFIHPELFEWILDDAVLGLVESLYGPDFHFFVSHFICKPGVDGRRVPWHEDSAYWKGILEPMEALTIWLAIDESTEENGCMKLVPRSHLTGRKGFSDYEGVDTETSVFPTEIETQQQRSDRAVPITLKPNQCSIHDARMIHGSEPNISGKRRCGYTMRFVPGHVRLQPEWESQLRLYPARGTDKAGNNLADPTRAYPELTEANRTGKKVH